MPNMKTCELKFSFSYRGGTTTKQPNNHTGYWGKRDDAFKILPIGHYRLAFNVGLVFDGRRFWLIYSLTLRPQPLWSAPSCHSSTESSAAAFPSGFLEKTGARRHRWRQSISEVASEQKVQWRWQNGWWGPRLRKCISVFCKGSRFKGAATERLDRVVHRIDREIFRFYDYWRGNFLFRDIENQGGIVLKVNVSISKNYEAY